MTWTVQAPHCIVCPQKVTLMCIFWRYVPIILFMNYQHVIHTWNLLTSTWKTSFIEVLHYFQLLNSDLVGRPTTKPNGRFFNCFMAVKTHNWTLHPNPLDKSVFHLGVVGGEGGEGIWPPLSLSQSLLMHKGRSALILQEVLMHVNILPLIAWEIF